jgi:hypothetical protein
MPASRIPYRASIARKSKHSLRRVVSALAFTACMLFPGIGKATEHADALITQTRQAPDAVNLKCEGNADNVFLFTVSETIKAVVWSNSKYPDQLSVYADGQAGLFSSADFEGRLGIPGGENV